MKTVNIYSDGGCSGNQHDKNLGGWGAVLEYGQNQKQIFGSEENTTNNRMELLALIRALEALTQGNLFIRVFSDSSYLVNCFKAKWYESWMKNGWKNSSKKQVENKDLWERLLELLSGHEVVFFHVKGHVNLKNEKTDIHSLHEKFNKSNRTDFSLDEFIHIVEMNNLADKLANEGISSLRSV